MSCIHCWILSYTFDSLARGKIVDLEMQEKPGLSCLQSLLCLQLTSVSASIATDLADLSDAQMQVCVRLICEDQGCVISDVRESN